MKLSYYILVPKGISDINISHADYSTNETAHCLIKYRNEMGNTLFEEEYKTEYPCIIKVINKFKEINTYMEIIFLDKNNLCILGSIDIFYQSELTKFGVSTAGITEYANNISKEKITSSIIKNCCSVSKSLNTFICILNPNPTNTPNNQRDGILKWKILDPSGNIISSSSNEILSTQMYCIDISSYIPEEKIKELKHPLFLSFVGDTNFNVFPITFTFINSIPTGCEHSQPKIGYYKSDKKGPQSRKKNILQLIPSMFR
jgi:hypothetical protein